MSPLRFDFGPDAAWPAAHFRPWRELVTELHEPAEKAFRALARRWPLRSGALLVHDPDLALLRAACVWTGEEAWDGEETVPLSGDPRLRRSLEGRKTFRRGESLFVPLGVAGLTPGFLRLEGLEDPAGGDETFLADVAQGLALSLWRVLLAVQERRRELHWRTLREVGLLVHQSLKPVKLLEDAAQRLVRNIGFDRVKVYLWDPRKRAHRGKVSCDLLRGVRDISGETFEAPAPRGLLDLVEGRQAPALRTRHAAALSAAGELAGWLTADNLLSQQEIPMDEVHLLEAVAGQLALAVRNAVLYEGVETLATTDALTGLLLGRVFRARLEEECRRAERLNTPFAVCMMDVDKFKGVNDTHGHLVGDKVLAGVARRLRAVSRRMDVVARYAGDEFVSLLPNAGAAQAMSLAARVNASVRKVSVSGAGGAPVKPTLSIGVAVYPAGGRTPDELIRSADEALYQAKRAGRDGAALHQSAAAPLS